MHKCVLKPLYGSVQSALHEFQVASGSWGKLQENLALAKTKKPRELGGERSQATRQPRHPSDTQKTYSYVQDVLAREEDRGSVESVQTHLQHYARSYRCVRVELCLWGLFKCLKGVWAVNWIIMSYSNDPGTDDTWCFFCLHQCGCSERMIFCPCWHTCWSSVTCLSWTQRSCTWWSW